jgi:hypothetical protein
VRSLAKLPYIPVKWFSTLGYADVFEADGTFLYLKYNKG